MKNRRNYYRILHVQPDAPVEIIKSSYRTLMQKLAQHPDLGGDHWNSSLINEAKAVLTDPVLRAEYDRQLLEFHTLKELTSRRQSRRQSDKTSEPVSATRRYESIIKHYCLFCKNPYPGNSRIQPDTICTQCQSPLYPVEKMKTEKSFQRSVNRIKKHQEIRFCTYWPPPKIYKGQIHDLSPHGMRFLTDQPFNKGQIIKIDSQVLQATARITNCRKQGSGLRAVYGIGVEFVSLHFQKSHGTFVSVTT